MSSSVLQDCPTCVYYITWMLLQKCLAMSLCHIKITFFRCGKSPGDILNNFYDGEECVSAAFVVGMASAGAGFIILVLLGAIIGLAVTNSGKSKKIKEFE